MYAPRYTAVRYLKFFASTLSTSAASSRVESVYSSSSCRTLHSPLRRPMNSTWYYFLFMSPGRTQAPPPRHRCQLVCQPLGDPYKTFVWQLRLFCKSLSLKIPFLAQGRPPPRPTPCRQLVDEKLLREYTRYRQKRLPGTVFQPRKCGMFLSLHSSAVARPGRGRAF